MAASKRDLDLAFVRNRTLSFVFDVTHNLNRQETGGVIDLLIYRKARVLQPVEYLIGVNIVAPCNLRNRNARKPRLCANHLLLVCTPAPTLALLRHTLIPVSVHLNKRTLNLTNDLWQSAQAGRLRDPYRRFCKAFGRRRARLAMHRIAAPHASSRKPCKAVYRGHYL